MKTTTAGLALQLIQPLTTMAKCCRIQWQDGTIFGFTSFDEDLDIEGETYTALPGMQDFAMQTHSGMAVDNTEIVGAIDDDRIRAEDVEDGKWDFAEVRFFEVDWQDLSLGILKLRRGWVGEITLARTVYTAELRGLMQALTREIGQLYDTSCDADLFDARCKVDPAPFTVTGTVTSVGDRRTFADSSRTEAERWFSDGVVTWTGSSLNAGKRMEVEYFSPTGDFVLFLQMRHPIQVGDTYTAVAGCDKRRATCVTKYNNVLNHRGYDLAPNADAYLAYPSSHT